MTPDKGLQFHKDGRDPALDGVKGLAILLVMIGHCIVLNGLDQRDPFLYDGIKSVQMPLFMLISGIAAGKGVLKFSKLKKRAVSYLVPFFSWFVISYVWARIRDSLAHKPVSWGTSDFLTEAKLLLFQTDRGLWFLMTLFVITVVMTICVSLTEKKWLQMVFMGVFYLLLILQARSGFLLLSPSLTVLYMPYYVLGYLWEKAGRFHRFEEMQTGGKSDRIFALCLIAFCALVFLFLVIRYPLTAPVTDTLTLAVQMAASLTGTIAIFGGAYVLLERKQSRVESLLAFIGQFTLEIYVLHFRFARFLGLGEKDLQMYSVKGILWLLAAFLLMSVLTAICIFVLKKVPVLDLVLFGKQRGKSGKPKPKSKTKEQGKQIARGLLLFMLVSIAFSFSAEVKAAEEKPTKVTLEFQYLDEQQFADGSYYEVVLPRPDNLWNLDLFVTMDTREAEYSVTSTDPKVIAIDKESQSGTIYGVYDMKYEYYRQGIDLRYRTLTSGKADIVVTVGDQTLTAHIYVVEDHLEDVQIEKMDWQTVRISWTETNPLIGYEIYQRAESDAKNASLTPILVTDPGASFVDLKVKRAEKYSYLIVPYMLSEEGKRLAHDNWLPGFTSTYFSWSSPPMYVCLKEFAERNENAGYKNAITEIVNTGKGQKITWHQVEDATSYTLFCSESENGPYKKVFSTDVTQTQTTLKKKRGRCYYYKLRTFYPDNSYEDSDTKGLYYPLKKAPKKKAVSVSTTQTIKYGQYDGQGNWSSADQTYYYQQSGKLHVVVVGEETLNDYTLGSDLKVKNRKTVKIGKHDTWGAFYHGEDGKNYVAVGFLNDKEKPNKTVIRVMQFSGKWKKQKTCNIKADVFFCFRGIWDEFRAGNGRMAMDGDRLMLLCPRGMFTGDDGNRHQSNIGFEIDTKKMTFKVADIYYVSHSFNQFLRFQNGILYQLDHGDGYPRSFHLTRLQEQEREIYTDEGEMKREIVWDKEGCDLLTFENPEGGNFTGANLGGMEIGSEHILVTGLSAPQNYTIAGVTGNEVGLKRNAFLCITSKEEWTTKLIWLTENNPKSSKVTVGESRIVKISNDRFVILYSTSSANSQMKKVHYVMVDDTGKILKKKTYNNMIFTGATQPILYNGSIFWSDVEYQWSGSKVYHYSIPVLQ